MIIQDCVLDLKRYWAPYGSVAPAATPWPDVSRFHTDGVVTTATWVQLPSGLWAKDFNSATPDYVVVTCPQLNFTSEDFSIVLRVKFDNFDAPEYLFTRGGLSTDGYFVYVHSNNKAYFFTNQVGLLQVTNTDASVTSTTEWYTLGFSRSGASVLIYVNGVENVETAGVHVNPVTCARTAKIGVRDDLAFPLDGQISFLKVFSYALTPDQQMQQHINLSNNWE